MAETHSPDDAVAFGFLDRVVPPGELLGSAMETAVAMMQLDMVAHQATKPRARKDTLSAIRDAIVTDATEFQELADASAKTTNP